MKKKSRLFRSILIALCVLVLCSPIVLAATYEFIHPIYVFDTGGTARTYVPILTDVTGQSLIDGGYINATGTDTNMEIGGSSVPYMLSTTQIATVAPTLLANSKVTYNLKTGYAPVQTSFDMIVGEDGYITIVDVVALEPGDNFVFEHDGYINTDAGADKNLIFKNAAFRTYISAGEQITSSITVIGAEVLREQSDAGDTTSGEAFGVNWGAQTWEHAADFYMTKVELYCFKTGNPAGILTVSLRATGADIPIGGDLISKTQDAATWGNTGWKLITFDAPYEYTAGTRLAFVMGHPGGDGLNYWEWGTKVANYANGRECESNDSGSTWTSTVKDRGIKVYGFTVTETTVTAINVANGEHTVETSADGVDLTISIDGAVAGDGYDTVALAGASVPDNGNDWIINAGNSTPYVDFYKHTVSGTLIVHYEPAGMITGATIPDLQGAAQNGTITWGANTNVIITFGGVESFESTTSGVGAEEIGFDVQAADMPTTWFGEGDITGLPFYDNFHDISIDTGIPTRTLYVFMVILLILSIGFLAIKTRQTLIASIVVLVVLWQASNMNILPAWVVFVYLIVGVVGMLYLRRALR